MADQNQGLPKMDDIDLKIADFASGDSEGAGRTRPDIASSKPSAYEDARIKAFAEGEELPERSFTGTLTALPTQVAEGGLGAIGGGLRGLDRAFADPENIGEGRLAGAGQWMIDQSEQARDLVDPIHQDGMVADTARGAGSMSVFMPLGGIGGMAGRGLSARLGAGATGQQRARRAGQFGAAASLAAPAGVDEAYERAIQYGLDPEHAQSVARWYGAPAGTVQVLNIGTLLRTLPRQARERLLANAGPQILRSMANEFGVEGAGALVQNWGQMSYDERQTLMDDVLYRGTIGALSAGVTQVGRFGIERGVGAWQGDRTEFEKRLDEMLQDPDAQQAAEAFQGMDADEAASLASEMLGLPDVGAEVSADGQVSQQATGDPAQMRGTDPAAIQTDAPTGIGPEAMQDPMAPTQAPAQDAAQMPDIGAPDAAPQGLGALPAQQPAPADTESAAPSIPEAESPFTEMTGADLDAYSPHTRAEEDALRAERLRRYSEAEAAIEAADTEQALRDLERATRDLPTHPGRGPFAAQALAERAAERAASLRDPQPETPDGPQQAESPIERMRQEGWSRVGRRVVEPGPRESITQRVEDLNRRGDGFRYEAAPISEAPDTDWAVVRRALQPGETAPAPQEPAPQQATAAPQQEPARGGRRPAAFTDPRAQQPGYLDRLPDVAAGAGWSERGGQAIRDTEGNVVGRTNWIPIAPWWADKPSNVTEAAVTSGVRKVRAGEPLNAAEKRAVSFLFDVIDQQEAQMEATDLEMFYEAIDADVLEADLHSEAGETLILDMLSSQEQAQAETEQGLSEYDRNFRQAEGGAPDAAAARRDAPGETSGRDEGRAGPPAAYQRGEAGGVSAGDQGSDPARPGRDAESREGLTLEQQTPEQLAQQQAERDAAEAAEAQRQERLRQQEQLGDFRLTGSPSPADQAMAAGQQDLLASPRRTPAETQPEATETPAPEAGVSRSEGLILKKDGTPFQTERAALAARNRDDLKDRKDQLEAVETEGGWALRDRRSESAESDQQTGDALTGEQQADPQVVDSDEADLATRTRAEAAGEGPDRSRLIAVREFLDAWLEDFTAPSAISGRVGDLYRRINDTLEQGGDLAQLQRDAADELRAWRQEADLDPDVATEIGGFIAGFERAGFAEAQAPAEPGRIEGEAQEVADAEAVEQDPDRVENVGEHLPGSRKDRAQLQSIEGTLDGADIANMPLSKIWPKAEIDKIEDTGLAAFATALRDSIPRKPRQSHAKRRWVEQVQTVRELMRIYMEDPARVRDKMMGNRSLRPLLDRTDVLAAIPRGQWSRVGSVSAYPDAKRRGADGQWEANPQVHVRIDNRPQTFTGASTVQEALPAIQEALGDAETSQAAGERQMKFTVRGRRGSYWIHKEGDPLYRKLAEGFSTGREALAYRDEHNADLVQEWEAVKKRDNVNRADVRRKENRERRGEDHRQGRDVTADEFRETFGFRGVQFGEWVGQGRGAQDRQGMINQAYDALMDLAAIIDMPPRAMSLNGDLGIAFGARGKGKAAAHYEPDQLVINLTKTKGAGSLAHEWFHALDNYFQRQRGAGQSRESRYITYSPETYYVHRTDSNAPRIPERLFDDMMTPGRALPDGRRLHPADRNRSQWEKVEGVRPEVGEAFASLVEALDDSPMAERSRQIDAGKGSEYWSRIIERGARAFENYVISKMHSQGYDNDYLANVADVSAFERNDALYPYLLSEEMPAVEGAFDQLFQTIETRETDSGVAMFSRTGDVDTARRALAEQFPDMRFHLGRRGPDSEGRPVWELTNMVVPEGQREAGQGSRFMEALLEQADAAGATLALDVAAPSDGMGTTSRRRLRRFYQGHGFTENRGRTRDHAVSAEMIREPQAGARFSREDSGDTVGIDVGEMTDAEFAQYFRNQEPGTEVPGMGRSGQRPLRADGSELRADEDLRTVGGGAPRMGWISASRVRDQGAGPRLVYRGARSAIRPDTFAVESLGQATGHPTAGLGVWFTSDQGEAGRYGSHVDSAYLDIRNPKVFQAENMPQFDSVEEATRYRDHLRAQGYDGIILDQSGVGGPVQFVAFEADQTILPDEGGAQFSFAGERAETADRYALSEARRRIDAGEDAEAVRQETGWFQGYDGRWRFEIDDSQASLNREMIQNLARGGFEAQRIEKIDYRKAEDGTWELHLVPRDPQRTADIGSFSSVTDSMLESMVPPDLLQRMRRGEGNDSFVGDFVEAKRIEQSFQFEGFNALPLDMVLDHPGLFAAYPRLREAMVQVDPSMGVGGAYAQMENGEPVIRIGRGQQLSTLLHEIQHAIQYQEGFARGGTESQFRGTEPSPEALRAAENLLEAERLVEGQGSTYEALLESGALDADQADQVRRVVSEGRLDEALEAARQVQRENLPAHAKYQRLAGEIEARNVQARQGMTAEERAATPPEATRDIPADQAVVVFNGREMQNAPPPVNARREAPQARPRAGLSVSDAQGAVDGLMGQWKGAPQVRAVQSEADLPQGLIRKIAEHGASGTVNAVYWRNRVYIVANKMNSTQDVREKVLHEVVGHHGLRKLVGDDLGRVLNRVWAMHGRNHPEVRDIIGRYFTGGRRFDVNNREHRDLVAEELIAHMAERGTHASLVQRAVSAVRDWLRRMGWDLGMTDADLANLIHQARRVAETGGMDTTSPSAMGKDDAAASRSEADTSLPDTIDVDGTPRPTRNSEGRVIHPTEEGVRNFWRWFDGSVAQDQDGQPLLMYHGTMTGIDRSGGPIYLTDSAQYANYYAGGERTGAPASFPQEGPYPIGDMTEAEQRQAVADSEAAMDEAEALVSREDRDFYAEHSDSSEVAMWDDMTQAQRDRLEQRRPGARERVERVREIGQRMQESDRRRRQARDQFNEVRGRDRIATPNVAPVYASIRNPWRVKDEAGIYNLASDAEAIASLQEQGYDGAIWINPGFNRLGEARAHVYGSEVIAFSPEQVKSATGNQGTFDADTDDIRFSRGEKSSPSRPDLDNMPAIENRYAELARLRGMWDSASDILRRHEQLAHVADAVDQFFDRTRMRMGRVNAIIRPAMKEIPSLNRKRRGELFRLFERYQAAKENGRTEEARLIREEGPKRVRNLIEAWDQVADLSGRDNQEVGVQVYDEAEGGWRPIGRVKGFFPRVMKREVQQALMHPAGNPETWQRIQDELLAAGMIEDAAEAQTYVRNYFSRETSNDYFAGVEKARKDPLPEWFYDYSWDAAMLYKDRWAERVSQIEAFGQADVDAEGDVFDKAKRLTTDQNTQNYLDQVQQRVYNTTDASMITQFIGALNIFATGAMLGNPATAALNLIGGTSLNFQAYGVWPSIRALGKELADFGGALEMGTQKGILINDYLTFMHDAQQQGVPERLSNFTSFMLKIGGYTPAEIFIRSHAMLTAKTFLEDSIARWNKDVTSKRSLQAVAWFKRQGFDYRQILDENGEGPETDRFLRKAVNLTQGSYRVNQVPVFTDTPVGRFLFKYQKFGTQLSRMFWINHLKPAIDSVVKGGEVVDVEVGGEQHQKRVRTITPLIRFFAVAGVSGTALAALREGMFGYQDPGPDFEEIEEQLAQGEYAEAAVLAAWRFWHSNMSVGSLGFFGNYAQFVHDVADRQRVKSPIDPPGLSPIRDGVDIGMRLFEQGTLDWRDLHDFTEGQWSLYRTWNRAALMGLSHVSDWRQAQWEAAQRDRRYVRKMVRRYSDDIGLENKRRAPDRIGHTEMTPYNRRINKALLLGESERARQIALEVIEQAETREEFDRTMMSLQASVRAYQPARVFESPSEKERRDFLRWAEERVGPDSFQRIQRIDSTFREAAMKAGLMSRRSPMDDLRDDLESMRGDQKLTPGMRRLLLMQRGMYVPDVDGQ